MSYALGGLEDSPGGIVPVLARNMLFKLVRSERWTPRVEQKHGMNRTITRSTAPAGGQLPASRYAGAASLARPISTTPPGGGLLDQMRELRFGAFWTFFLKQSPSFWLVSMYLMFEYVRPQSIYPSLDVLPWGQVTLIGTAIAVFFEGKLLKRWDSSEPVLLLFTAVVLMSCFAAVSPEAAFSDLKRYLLWVLIFFLITRSIDSEARFFFFYVLFLLFSLKMSQHATRSWMGAGFRFREWGATGAPGWFRNSGEMAIQMTIFLPMSAYFAVAMKPYLKGLTKKWKYWAVLALPVSALFALLASSSRGGQLGGAAVMLFMLLRSRKRMRGLLLTVVLGASIWFVLPEQQKTRFTEMGDDKTSQSRIEYWRNGIEIANQYPWLGIGYNNWIFYYPLHYPQSTSIGGYQLPHNIFVEAGSELGYVGLGAFLLLIGWTFKMNAATRKLSRGDPHGHVPYYMSLGLDAGLVGFLVSGFFVTVLYYPYFWINFALSAALWKTMKSRPRAPTRPPVALQRRPGPGRPRHLAPAGSR